MKTLIIVDMTTPSTPRLECFINHVLRYFRDLFSNSFLKPSYCSNFLSIQSLLEITPEEIVEWSGVGTVWHPFCRRYK